MQNIHVFDFDDSVIKQSQLIAAYKPAIIDLRDVALQTRILINKKNKAILAERIKGLAQGSINFLGSGDFHHVSSLLVNQINEPISLIVFDFHPDWDAASPNLSCGSWVKEVLDNKNIQKVIIIGASSSDISTWHLQNGSLAALESRKLEIYPYEHGPSWAFFYDNSFLKKISWLELKNRDLMDFFTDILAGLPTQKVYVSIDKDCLKNKFALTNWEEGLMNLDELLLMLKLIKDKKEIVSLDITGDYSQAKVEGWFKKYISFSDRPKNIAATKLGAQEINQINQETNLRLLELLTKAD